MLAYGEILIVDDEPQVRQFLRAALQDNGFRVLEAHDGQEAILRTSIDRPSLVVLDLGLPDLGGLDVVRRVRECTNVPIIGLMALGGRLGEDRLRASGADDCLVKPFGVRRLIARINGALRSRARAPAARTKLRRGDVTIDLIRRSVFRGGTEVKLTPKEYSLLRVLARNSGRVVTHSEILCDVWGLRSHAPAGSLRTYVSRLRWKLEADPPAPRLIVTERAGYRIAGELT